MRYVFFLWLMCHNLFVVSQTLSYKQLTTGIKKKLDVSSFDGWPSIEKWSIKVSNDGRYALYVVGKGLSANRPTLMIHALDGSWQASFSGIERAIITKDSRQAVFMSSNDSLCILSLGTSEKHYIPKVKSYTLVNANGFEWLVCHRNNIERELLFYRIKLGKKFSYLGVDQYFTSTKGSRVLVLTASDSNNNALKWIEFSGDTSTIWEGIGINNVTLDPYGRQVAFRQALSVDSNLTNNIWYYKYGTPKAVPLHIKNISNLDSNLAVDNLLEFSGDGTKLFVNLIEKRAAVAGDSRKVKVNIWSYLDPKIQSQQISELKYGVSKNYRAAINLSDNKIFRLQFESDEISLAPYCKSDQFFLVTSREGEASEDYWNKASQPITYLVFASTGERKRIRLANATISPNGRYVVGYPENGKKNDILLYEIASGKTTNVTNLLPEEITNPFSDTPQGFLGLVPAAWMDNDAVMLVYDSYDIWYIDLKSKVSPINLTNGRSQNLVFRFIGEAPGRYLSFRINERVILKTLNKVTKDNGFSQLTLNSNYIPQSLYQGGYVLFDGIQNVSNSFDPIKAIDAQVYLVSRQSAAEAPNIFTTTNFRTFTQISNVHPEKAVNWYTSKLLSYSTQEGVLTQGIIYVPENFDSSRKYPVIISYYDKMSDQLNKYHSPKAPGGGELDVAWFASNEYLVMLTDIHFTIGRTGESLKAAVEAAVQHLSTMSFVDVNNIGIQGHSFGGYETNYLITHSSRFAAAVSSCGISNVTSFFGNLWPGGHSKQEYVETRGLRMASTPWDCPERFVRNSPIYSVGNITTPLLMMANKDDMNVQFEEGLQFFTALRRAGKRVWMLEYDNGGHGVSGDDYKDYIIRMTQFFNHYLKGAPAPKWMTQGVKAKEKGLDDGLDLDEHIKTPGEGLLSK